MDTEEQKMSGIEGPVEKGLINYCVGEIARNIQAPSELINATALAAMATALQGVIDVESPDGRVIPTSLYILIRGLSGERKSAVYNKLFKQLKINEQAEIEDYSKRKLQTELATKIWKKKVGAIENKIGKLTIKNQSTKDLETALADLYEKKPKEPKCFTVLYDDVTPEALVYEMSERSKYAALVSSEGASILGGAMFKSFAKLNSLWGGETIKIDRKSSGTNLLEDGRLSMCIMVQPEVQDRYIKSDNGSQRSSGLWARFLLVDPVSQIGNRPSNMAPATWTYTERFGERLADFYHEAKSIHDGCKPRYIMKMSPEASSRFVMLSNGIEADSAPGRHFHGFSDHSSKLAENMLRYAALYQAVQFGVKSPITLSSLETAISFCATASSNFMKVFHAPSEFERDCKQLHDWLCQIRISGKRYLRKTYILKYGPGRLRRVDRLDSCLYELERFSQISNILVNGIKCIDLLPGHFYIHDAAVIEVSAKKLAVYN